MPFSLRSAKTRQYLTFAFILAASLVLTPLAYMHFNPEEVFWRKGQQAFAAGDYEEAVRYYSRALQDGKVSYMLLDRLGDSYISTGSPEMGVVVFLKLRKKHPEDPYVTLKLALAYWAMNDSRKALETVEDALDLKAGWRNALFLKAGILTGLGEFEKAINIYGRILGEEL
ncbi:tetratricopeptide repeat protein [Desulfonatronospira sp.]|uniref:tetratricopeptide repeat protein n=1 Tax=Desulfonatronospira sp. TaxID=1962951 RepID=UPI0025B8A01B|nr:tetratricopeptide repeat protein [Desulfonatronospira sp.]